MAHVTPPKAPRLFLVDGYALIYRAFYALLSRPLTTKRGENTSAAWGIATFLKLLRSDHGLAGGEYIGWVLDSGLSFRHEQYAAYKATRQKLSEELQNDFDRGMERISALLEANKIPVITCHGYEADDVIGTLARQGVEKGVSVVIVSGDKDFQQLVRPGIWLLNPGRGGPADIKEHWVGVENADERLGVPPSLVTDYFSMVGDTSDNIPGVPGIGEKTAAELVKTYGSLESILDHAGEITKKRPREALLQYHDQARLSKRLVTIHDDVPVTLDLESLAVQEPDRDRLRHLYVELEFNTLVRELGPTSATPASSVVEAERPAAHPTLYVTVETEEAVKNVIAEARQAGSFTFTLATVTEPGAPIVDDPLRSNIVGIALSLEPYTAYYLPLGHRDWRSDGTELVITGTSIAAKALSAGVESPRNLPAGTLDLLRLLFEDAGVRKSAYDAKRQLLVLRRAGIELRGVDFDPMIASYVLDPGRRSHSLDQLVLEFLDQTRTTQEDLCGKGKNAIPFDQVPITCARDYAGADVDAAGRLRTVFEPLLQELALAPLFNDIEIPLSGVLAEMESAGITIDVSRLRAMKAEFQAERERVEEAIYAEAGERFNINSNPQLRTILFDKLKLTVRKRTATGASTDASVLQELADEGETLPVLLLSYRELFKLEGTYLDALPLMVHPADGRVHTSFSQTVAATGRLSSNDPNLQNIPIRGELGRQIRRAFIPRAGSLLISADYSQIELRLLAHLSHDPAFVEAFKAGGDIHRQTASILFDVPLDLVTPVMRARAKTVNFATIYGQGPHALSRQLKIEHAEAKAFIARYFERFGGIRAYLDNTIEQARSQGYVQTIFGRRRYIPELRDRNYNIRAFGERAAQNSPIQGSAADLIKIAMIHIDRRLRAEHPEARMLLQVHDELVFEVPERELEPVEGLVRHEMEHAADLSVPLVVDIGVGHDWLETKE
ncbi:MAG TPA: DNA polymerase I [Gemmatimonadaceae bacterium]|nr:DNA polymerase I [Gemmatimonadaceae bacterium]